MWETLSVVFIEKLLISGAYILVFGSVAIHEAQLTILRTMSHLLFENIYYSNDMYDAVFEADDLLLVTEWKKFCVSSWAVINKTMRNSLVLNGRNIY